MYTVLTVCTCMYVCMYGMYVCMYVSTKRWTNVLYLGHNYVTVVYNIRSCYIKSKKILIVMWKLELKRKVRVQSRLLKKLLQSCMLL